MEFNRIRNLDYNSRPKARVGNATEDGSKPATPEGRGDLWISENTLSVPSSDGSAWVDHNLAGGGGGGANSPFVILHRATDLVLDGFTADQAVTWDGEIVDTDGEHDTSTNADRILFANQGAGTYKATLNLVLDTGFNNDGDDAEFKLMLNNSSQLGTYWYTHESSYMLANIIYHVGRIDWYFDISTPLSDYVNVVYDPTFQSGMTNNIELPATASGRYYSTFEIIKVA